MKLCSALTCRRFEREPDARAARAEALVHTGLSAPVSRPAPSSEFTRRVLASQIATRAPRPACHPFGMSADHAQSTPRDRGRRLTPAFMRLMGAIPSLPSGTPPPTQAPVTAESTIDSTSSGASSDVSVSSAAGLLMKGRRKRAEQVNPEIDEFVEKFARLKSPTKAGPEKSARDQNATASGPAPMEVTAREEEAAAFAAGRELHFDGMESGPCAPPGAHPPLCACSLTNLSFTSSVAKPRTSASTALVVPASTAMVCVRLQPHWLRSLQAAYA